MGEKEHCYPDVVEWPGTTGTRMASCHGYERRDDIGIDGKPAIAGASDSAPLASRYRLALIAAVVLAAALGYGATPDAASAQAVLAAGPELTRLLRLMAVIKLALAAAALGLVGWRLRFPVSPGMAWAYVAGCASMAAGPGLIWTMAHVVPGAVLLHGGLAVVLMLGWVDDGLRAGVIRRRADHRRFGPPDGREVRGDAVVPAE